MQLKGIHFKNVFAASGTLNFFGNGWWYHFWYKLFCPGFKKIKTCTFVAKTTTLYPRPGNMPLKKNLQPKALMPGCIKLYPFKGIVLNAVGLSGPGAFALFSANYWQKIKDPFFISFMAVETTSAKRLEETKSFIHFCRHYFPRFTAPVGIQVNISCPNTEHELSSLENETISILRKFAVLNVPIDLKVNVFFDIALLKKIEEEKLCDVITVSNTIPFGAGGDKIDWKKLFPKGESPLKKYGGGGLSGEAILPLVLEKIKKMRLSGIKMPIKGGGGIMHVEDVYKMREAGANAIEFATVSMLRPWRVKKIIKVAENIFNKKRNKK